MRRDQISLFLYNGPGELGRLAELLGGNGVNIEALSIQDASSYVTELFKARGKSIKRIASRQSYVSMSQDSNQFALIRLLVDDTEKAAALLEGEDYQFDLLPVFAVHLDNNPGELAAISSKFGREGININYVYGSVADSDGRCLFVFCPQDIELADKVFGEE